MKKQNKMMNSEKLYTSTNVHVSERKNTIINQGFIMQPKVDYCFKELMKDMDILKGFLSAVLDIDVNDIVSVDSKPAELRKFSEEDKYGILDVRVNLNNDKHIDMEIQVRWLKTILKIHYTIGVSSLILRMKRS